MGQGSPEAAAAEPPCLGRPWRPSNLGALLFRESGIKFCTQIDVCAAPPELGGVFPKSVTVKGIKR